MKLEPDYIFPEIDGFKGNVLDAYLADGYYRMQHLIFTTHHTQIDTNSHRLPVFWLRTIISAIKEKKSAHTIRKKCSEFKVTYQPAKVTEEIENLYALYKNHVHFSTADTCNEYLHMDLFENPWDAWMIEIRDGTLLIAVGYFDKGTNAIAGILNIYHPSYHQYSLGKYLILQKIDYAKNNQINYYYTGYISTASTKFDYKIFPDIHSMQVFLPVEKKWAPYAYFTKDLLEAYFFNHILGMNFE